MILQKFSKGSLVLLLLWIPPLYGFSCSEGPPGRYCTNDLSGYHICQIMNGTLTDTIVSCPANSRCSCFVGPACQSCVTDPCSSFVVPPTFNYSFTLRYHGITTDIAPPGTFKRNTQGLWYQLIEGASSKRSFTDWGVSMTKTVTVPSSKVGWIEYVNYGERFCSNQTLAKFPVYGVPWDFNYDGNEQILGKQSQRWKRVTGGRHTGSPRTTEYHFTARDEQRGVIRPVRYTSVHTGLRSTRMVTRDVGLFYAQLVPYSMVYFWKPQSC